MSRTRPPVPARLTAALGAIALSATALTLAAPAQAAPTSSTTLVVTPTSRSARSPTWRPAALRPRDGDRARRQPGRAAASRTPSCRWRPAAASCPTASSPAVTPSSSRREAAKAGAKVVVRMSD